MIFALRRTEPFFANTCSLTSYKPPVYFVRRKKNVHLTLKLQVVFKSRGKFKKKQGNLKLSILFSVSSLVFIKFIELVQAVVAVARILN